MKHDYHEARLVATAIGIIPAIWVYLVDINHPFIMLAAMVLTFFCFTISFVLFSKAKKWKKEQQSEIQDE